MNIFSLRQDIVSYFEQNGNKFTSCKDIANHFNVTYHQIYHAINGISESLCIFEKQYAHPIKYRLYY